MKISLLKIYNSRSALLRLAADKLPTKVSYCIQKNVRALEPKVLEYQNGLRDIVFGKYKCTHIGNGVYQPADKTKTKELQEEVKALEGRLVEADVKLIPLSSIDSISAMDLMDLEFMIIDDIKKINK